MVEKVNTHNLMFGVEDVKSSIFVLESKDLRRMEKSKDFSEQ